MMQFFKEYFREDGAVSSKRANVAYFIFFFTVITCIGMFTKLVKSEHIFDVVVDACMFIIIGGTLGVTATDVFRRKGAKVEPQQPEEPEPVEPEKKNEPVRPEPDEPQPEVRPKPDPKPAPVSPIPAVDVEFIKRHEGCKLDAYLCPGKIWTIGYGSTTHPDGRPVKKGDKITAAQANEYLAHEVSKRLAMIQPPIWMNKNQRTAILSWHYNCGHGAWMKSHLRALILQRAPKDKVVKQWTSKYITAKGKVLPGLVKRRREEAELYYS